MGMKVKLVGPDPGGPHEADEGNVQVTSDGRIQLVCDQPDPVLYCESITASKSKVGCGYPGFVETDPVRYYKTRTTTNTSAGSSTSGSNCTNGGDYTTNYSTTWNFTQVDVEHAYCPTLEEPQPNEYSGGGTRTDTSDIAGYSYYFPGGYLDDSSVFGLVRNPTTGEWTVTDTIHDVDGSNAPPCYADDPCVVDVVNTNLSFTIYGGIGAGCVTPQSHTEVITEQTKTTTDVRNDSTDIPDGYEVLCNGPGPNAHQFSACADINRVVIELSEELTLESLIDMVESALPDYPNNWICPSDEGCSDPTCLDPVNPCPCGYFATGQGCNCSASYNLSPDESSLTIEQFHYFFQVDDTNDPPDNGCVLKWIEQFIPDLTEDTWFEGTLYLAGSPDPDDTHWTKNKKSFTFDGDATQTEIFEVEHPDSNGVITIEDIHW